MPKLIMNELIKAFRGAMGDMVFRQMPDGSVVVSMRPIFHRRTPALAGGAREFSQAQKV